MKRALLLSPLLLSALPLSAQQKRPMTFADLQAIKRVSDPQISRSGKWVLFSVTDVSLEKNTKTNHLWVVPLAGGKEVQVTTGSGESNGRFSPDGRSAMYSADDRLQMASWDDAAGKMGKATAITREGADGGIWAPDSKHFLFTSNVYPECESKLPMGLPRNKEEQDCNEYKDAVAAKSQVKALVFDHLLYRHWTSYQGAKHSHIFYGSVRPEEAAAYTDLTPASVIGDHEAPTFSVGGPLGYAISPDGKEVAYVTNLDKVPAASTNNDIFVLQVGAEPSTAKKVSTSPGSDDGPQYSPDGKWLAWRSQARNGFESDKFVLAVMDRSSGAVRNLTKVQRDYSKSARGEPSELDMWIDEFIWADTSREIFYVSSSHGEEPIYSVGVDGVELHRYGKASGEWSGLSLLRIAGNFEMVAGLMRVDMPTEIAAFDAVGTDDSTRTIKVALDNSAPNQDVTQAVYMPRNLTHLNDALLSNFSRSPLESFLFTGAANTKVEGFLVKPPNFDPAKKYPVKFLMHGGPQTAWGDAWSYRWNWQLMAANGYVVVGINRRGSTGYGQKFVDEVSGDWGGKAYVDLMKGLDYAEAKFPFIDKTRECALGASYGGFMANWVLTHTDRFKCIVTHDGMYNPQSAWGTTEEMWFNEWEFRRREQGAGNREQKNGGLATKPAQPWDFVNASNEADPFRKFSPMLHIKNAHTPTLVIHSQRDYRLDVSEGFQLFSALQRLGVPSKMLYFPDEGHWVLKPQNSQLWYETVNDWCDRWLGMNKYAGIGPEANPMARKTLTAPVQSKPGQGGRATRAADK